jgi:hypothetical protein
VAQRTDPAAVAAAVLQALRAPDYTALLNYARARIETMTPPIVANAYISIISSAAEIRE